jgi:hypothetical protein
MVDHLVGGLRARGVLDQPTGLLIRIGLNALDRFDAMGELPLRLPNFLAGVLGERITCQQLAREWRGVAGDAHALLHLLGRFHVGQHVHLARLLALNARGEDPLAAAAADPRLAKLVRQSAAIPDGELLLRRLGQDLPPAVVECIERLATRRSELLSGRKAQAAEAAATHPGGRLVPNWPAACQEELERLDCQLQLLVAAYVRRLWQRAESLPYLNDRPYTLALYLLFGRDIFPPICRNVEFDVEYVSPIPVPTRELHPSGVRTA